MLILIRLLGYVLAIFASWALFLALPCWVLGLSDCRAASRWSAQQRVTKFFDLKSRRLAGLLIAPWGGDREKYPVCPPWLYSRFWLNVQPQRMSLLGLLDWCMTVPLFGWYLFELTRFYLNRPPNGGGLPLVLAVLVGRTALMTLLLAWNCAKEQPEITMSRREWRRWRRAARRGR